MTKDLPPILPKGKTAEPAPEPFRSIGELVRRIEENLIAGAGNVESSDKHDS
jgi:hypothetical protein